jgi:radical SAM protein with 4Fe4S-binding SPASM domain
MEISEKSLSKYPYQIGWFITNKCNLKCVHCNMESGTPLNNELDFEECRKLIDDFSEHSVNMILFSGGEPLIRKDFFKISDYAISKGIRVGFTTNGTLITDDIIQDHLYKFDFVRVSLDGHNAQVHDYFRGAKGTYNRALTAIKNMCNEGLNVSVSTCVSRLNLLNLEDIALLLKENGVSKWCLPIFSAVGRGKDITNIALTPNETKELLYKLDDLENKYNLNIRIDLPYVVTLPDLCSEKGNKSGCCPAAFTELTIFADGNVSPCFELPLSCGNVRDKSISEIWNDSKVFNEFRDKTLIKGKCKSCSYLYSCGGGCRAVAYNSCGDYLGDDTACWLR